MPKIGPFFYIRNRLIYEACPLSEGRKQADKLDNSYGHDRLYEDHFRSGDYIDYPRGRVVWDCTENLAIVYIDKCLQTSEVLSEIETVYELGTYVIREDEHYRCPRCMGAVWI